MTETRLLGGRYQLGELAGYGGMAEVHRGRDQRLGRDVAIKILRADLARDENFQVRFRREAQNAAALNHPAIVAVYDTGEEHTPEGSLPYIVMEWVEGRTLKEVLTEEGSLMPQRALEIVGDVCAALEFSHRHGIIHRDIKPGNVMLTRTGVVKVMDFGIARAISSATAAMTQTSAVIGTAQYLSPEQARGESVDARSDVYSAGCLLYELLVGHPPFTGDNPVAVAYQHVREDPIPPGELNPEVTGAMDAVVLKAMAKNPANRYQSGSEMRTDALRAAAGRQVGAPAVMSAAERTAVLPSAGRPGAPVEAEPLEDQPRSKKAVTWALVTLGLVAIFAVSAFITLHLLGGNQGKVSVPDVKGKLQAEATSILENKGFKVTPKPVTSTEAERGRVVGQNPGPDEEADKNSEVQIEVGKGPDQKKVPSLDGLSKDGAKQTLEQAELKASFIDVDSAKQPGSVVSYSPGKDTMVPKDSTVEVKISKGNLKIVPNVVNQSLESAEAELAAAGFTATVKVQEVTSTQPEGTVVNQSLEANSEQKPNAPITLDVAKAGGDDDEDPTEPGPTKPSSSPPPGSGTQRRRGLISGA